MTHIFEDDFESEPSPPTLAKWGAPTVNTGNFFTIVAGAHGTKALECNCLAGTPASHYQAWVQTSFAALSDVYCRVYFKALDFNGTTDGTPIDLRASSAQFHGMAWTHISPAGIMSLYYNDVTGNNKIASGSFTLDNNWHCIEVHARLNTATAAPFNGLAELFVDGNLVASASGIDNRTTLDNTPAVVTLGPITVAQVGERWYNGTLAHAVDIDDVVVADAGPIGLYGGPTPTAGIKLRCDVKGLNTAHEWQVFANGTKIYDCTGLEDPTGQVTLSFEFDITAQYLSSGMNEIRFFNPGTGINNTKNVIVVDTTVTPNVTLLDEPTPFDLQQPYCSGAVGQDQATCQANGGTWHANIPEKIFTIGSCPTGYHWDTATQSCVVNTTPTPSVPIWAIAIGVTAVAVLGVLILARKK